MLSALSPLLVLVAGGAAARVTRSFDFDWRFYHGDHPGYTRPTSSCNVAAFPINLTGVRCDGLQPVATATSQDSCRNAACASASTEVYQWDLTNNGGQPRCWVGSMHSCVTKDTTWVSGGRNAPSRGFQPVVPAPQPCPDSPTCPTFEDKAWRRLDVPHDFVVEGTFTPDADRNHGFLPFNMSWYRKAFTVDQSWDGKSIWIDFDGVYRASDFWLNGIWIGHHESGYTPFRWYLHNQTGVTLNYGNGTRNILSVRVDALTHQEGWFYEGGGIYRHTKINAADPVAVVPWGVYAPSVIAPGSTVTGTLDGPQSAGAAILSLKTDVANGLPNTSAAAQVAVSSALYDADGLMVTKVTTAVSLNGTGFVRVAQQIHWPSKPPQPGDIVQMADCDDSFGQRFKLVDGQIQVMGASGSTLCLDAGFATPGQAPLVLKACEAAAPSQAWSLVTKGTCHGGRPCANHIAALGKTDDSGRCLDIFGVVGPQLDIFPCTDQPSQEFAVAGGAIAAAGGRCLAAVPPSQRGLDVVHGPNGPDDVRLWNLARPYLYTVVTTVTGTTGAQTFTDTVNTTIGVRSAVFSADRGFLLNGLPQKIKGLSMHQDFGGCGTAVPDRANEYRVTSLKQMGATGWRTAHNPVNSEILDYTDLHGMLVWSENRNLERQVIGVDATEPRVSSVRRKAFTAPDGTLVGADWKGVDPLYLDEAQAMVLRDRNHPSIIIWSLCNEGGCMQGDPDGGYVGTAFKSAIFAADTSRPITANSEDTVGDTLTHAMDVNSFSYNYAEYDAFHIKYPFRSIVGGESASCTFDRGRYLGLGNRANASSGWVDADDADCQVAAWGSSAGPRPWIVGNFAWTGWDYKGEPTPSNWPAINSHFGIIDISGFPKDAYYYYAAWWRNDQSVLHILPQDWNSPVPVSHALDVVIFSAGATVELWVNEVSLGKKSVPNMGIVRYTNVTFAPGSLKAVSWDVNGQQLANSTVTTTKPAAAIVLSAEAGHEELTADGQDTALVRVEIQDADGNFVPSANQNISFTIEGPGRIYGVANGDPVDHSPDKAVYRAAFKGLARVLVQASRGTPGQIVLHATADDLKGSSLVLTTH